MKDDDKSSCFQQSNALATLLVSLILENRDFVKAHFNLTDKFQPVK
jgi:hypothetical protein